MRVRVPKRRRVEDFLEGGCRVSGLSERLEERTEAILRMLEDKTRQDKERGWE